MNPLSLLLSGVLFGTGLVVSGMNQPAKIVGFLDLFGRWDPSLMFVMMGALAVQFALRPFIERRATPVFESEFHLPAARAVDGKLVIGASVFGVGWGLAGMCPGAAFAAFGTAALPAAVLLGSVALGMLGQHFLHAPRRA